MCVCVFFFHGYLDFTFHLEIKLCPTKESEMVTLQNLWRQKMNVYCYWRILMATLFHTESVNNSILNKANFSKDLLNPSFRYFVFSDEEAFQVLTGMVKKLVIN